MRLCLVVSSLASGGAERVLATLANHWIADGHQVTIITLASEADDRLRLRPGVTRIALGMMTPSTTTAHAFRNNWLRVKHLRDEIRRSRPDAVISFLSTTNVLTLVATRTLHVPVVVSERIDPREEKLAAPWAGMRRLLYPRADALVVQTPDVAGWAVRFVPAQKVHVIPNPVTPPRRSSDLEGAGTPEWLARSVPRVVAMGRLTRQKGFDLLLRAFAKCRERHPEWSLVILGEGEERSRLEALACELGIESNVALPGHVPDPVIVLQRADLFVLCSRYEGFPNALVEAMACGVPVVATDCPSGPRHIVRDGIDGLLVAPESPDTLVAAMEALMGAPDMRRRLGAQGVDVVRRFSLRRVMHKWDDLLARCTSSSRRVH